MYAIIEEQGKQYKVTTGDVVRIDRPVGEEKTLKFDRILLIGGEGAPKVGAPTVPGASVSADVLGQIKSKKIENVKYNRRKGYHRTVGHRQQYTEIKITAINA
jgi:large subunit ribosomal protein L21